MFPINNPFKKHSERRTSEERGSSIPQNSKLKALGISLIVIAILVLASSIALAVTLGNPLIIAIAVPGACITLVTGLVLSLGIGRKNALLKIFQNQRETDDSEEFSTKKTRKFFKTHFQSCKQGDLNKYKLPTGHLSLYCTQGGIEFPGFPISSDSVAIVFNAANPEVHPGGPGVNGILSESVTQSSWKGSGPAGNKALLEGQATAGEWSSSTNYCTLDRPGAPWKYLGQVLGPTAKDHNNSAKSAFPGLKQAFKSAILKGIDLKCNFIQLPLISSGMNAPSNGERSLETWRAMVGLALFEVLKEIEATYPDSADGVDIVIIDFTKKALSEFID